MNRAKPKDLRRALEVAHSFAKSGIRFVCVPVADEDEFRTVATQANDSLNKMLLQAEQQEAQ